MSPRMLSNQTNGFKNNLCQASGGPVRREGFLAFFLRVSCWVGLWITVAAPAEAQLQYPLDIAVHDSGLYIADRNLPGVWKTDQQQLLQFFTGSKKFRTPLNAIRCVALDQQGQLLAGDSSTREVFRFGDDGKPVGLTDGGIGIPMGIATTSAGELLVADLELHRIWKVPSAGGKAELLAEVPAPRGVCIDEQDGLWVVSHGTETQLVRIGNDGAVQAKVKGRPFRFPNDVAVDGNGTAYISDGYAKAIWKLPRAGKPEKWVTGEPLVNPVGIVLRGSHLLVADPHAKAIFQIDSEGKVLPLALESPD